MEFTTNYSSQVNAKITPIKQRDDSACGPTSIEMVANYFKVPLSAEEIASASRYRKTGGMTNVGMVETLKKLGFKVKEKSGARWSSIIRANTSDNVIIVSWMLFGYIGHFSVVEKIDKDNIYLADPHTGEITKMEKVIFMRLWMDYDQFWYPKKNTDIQLRWMCVVSRKGTNRA